MLSRVVIILVVAGTVLPSALQKAGDAGELAAYRLTPANLRKVIRVNRAVLQALMKEPKVKETLAIEAELETLRSKTERTQADEGRIAELETRRQELESEMDNPLGGDAETLTELEARVRSYPPMAEVLQRQGMSPREYAKFWLTFLQAAFAHGFQKSGMLKALPAGVNPENVRFIAEHEAEIAAMQKEFERLGRRR